MSKPGLSMPLNWGDLLADTLHLTRGDFGAYMLLIGAYWSRRGPLPDDDAILCTIARCEPAHWPALRPILAKFFVIKNGTWTHKRVETELAAATQPRTAPEYGIPMPSTPSLLRKPADLDQCVVMAQRIGLSDQDARDWYRDCEAAQWRRGDGTLFDNWPRQMSLHRDILREKRSRTTARPGAAQAPANPAAELILRQNELKRVEERIRVIKGGYDSHTTWDEKDRKEYAKLRDRRKELISLLGMSA